jgi:uncharacterized membrane protein
MSYDNDEVPVAYIIITLLVFILGFVIGFKISESDSYKKGQLDYQAGIIEYQMIEGKIHHIEKAVK